MTVLTTNEFSGLLPGGSGVSSRKEVLRMRLVSPRIQLAAVAVGAAIAAALLGGCPWGP
jgi:hypothetical protein